MTLFIPDGVEGFVSRQTGDVSLSRVLIPITSDPSADLAIAAAVRTTQRLHCPEGEFTLLHVGEDGSEPSVHCPEVPGWSWDRRVKHGDVVHAILETAGEAASDLIVMTTKGRHGFLDALRGSSTENVLRNAPCPLLAIPESSLAAGALTSG
jgi:hypothetical protein